MTAGQLLLLTGTTGSGKTTTCNEFVARRDELWLHFGADQFLGGVMPRKFVDGGPRAHEGLQKVPIDPANPDGPRTLRLGRYGLQMFDTFHAMVAAGVRAGQRFIVDHITTVDPPLLQSCITHFRDLPVFFVALKPPLEVIPERLDGRLDKIVTSLSREQANIANQNTKRMADFLHSQIFTHEHFDLVIDSSTQNPAEIVDTIAAAMATGPGRAFVELTRKLDAGMTPFRGT
jgi:chloramphenicol 3-O-phosphotransferase